MIYHPGLWEGGGGGFDDKKSIKGDYRKLTANLLQRGEG